MDRSHHGIFPFRAIGNVVHQAAVLGNVKLCLILSNVFDAICFYLDVRINHPLLSEWSSSQNVIKIVSKEDDVAVELALRHSSVSRFLDSIAVSHLHCCQFPLRASALVHPLFGSAAFDACNLSSRKR